MTYQPSQTVNSPPYAIKGYNNNKCNTRFGSYGGCNDSDILTRHCRIHTSRNDDSATMWKERSLWRMSGAELKPWDDEEACGSWYRMNVCTPSEAIQNADRDGAYLLSDRATVLRQTALGRIGGTTVFFEPRAEDDVLMNSCFALYSPDEERGRNLHVKAFLEYVVSERGQKVVRTFGERAVGVPFFARVRDGFERRGLRGGVVKNGRWVADCGL